MKTFSQESLVPVPTLPITVYIISHSTFLGLLVIYKIKVIRLVRKFRLAAELSNLRLRARFFHFKQLEGLGGCLFFITLLIIFN